MNWTDRPASSSRRAMGALSQAAETTTSAGSRMAARKCAQSAAGRRHCADGGGLDYWCIHTRRRASRQAGRARRFVRHGITTSVAELPTICLCAASAAAPSIAPPSPIPRPPPRAPRPIPSRPISTPRLASKAHLEPCDACRARPASTALPLPLPPPRARARSRPRCIRAACSSPWSSRRAPELPCRADLMFRDQQSSVEDERSERFTRDRMQPGEPAYQRQRPTTQTPLSTARPLTSPTTPAAHPQSFPHTSPHHHAAPTSPGTTEHLPPLSTALYTASKSSYYDPTSDHGVGQPHGTAARYESQYPSQVRVSRPPRCCDVVSPSTICSMQGSISN